MEPVSRLRAARPTTADGLAFAELADMAAGGLFTVLLGGAAHRVVAGVFRERGTDLSYEHAAFLELDGATAGMVSGFTGRRHRADRGRTARRFARHAGLRLGRVAVVAARTRRVLAFMDTVGADRFYIQFLAVLPGFRGRGLSRPLLDWARTAAYQNGSGSLALDVDVTNAVAIGAYERYGFVPVARSARAGALQVQRMEKPLLPAAGRPASAPSGPAGV